MTATLLLIGHKEKELQNWKTVQALLGKTGKEGKFLGLRKNNGFICRKPAPLPPLLSGPTLCSLCIYFLKFRHKAPYSGLHARICVPGVCSALGRITKRLWFGRNQGCLVRSGDVLRLGQQHGRVLRRLRFRQKRLPCESVILFRPFNVNDNERSFANLLFFFWATCFTDLQFSSQRVKFFHCVLFTASQFIFF